MTIGYYLDSQGMMPDALPKPTFYGRREIRSRFDTVTSANVIEILNEALPVFMQNKAAILYLWWYYRGYQPIINREKAVRPEINHPVVENRANEIVSFKVGYEFGEPVQYIGRSADVTEQIKRLNDMMFYESKATHDRDLCEWWEICGTSYRMVLADDDDEKDEAPFEIYTLDPTRTFVIYTDDYRNEPLLGVFMEYDDFNMPYFVCYSKNRKFVVKGSMVWETPHPYGDVPIFEYKANNARLGSFEIVMSMLDAINTVASNRVDAVEQFVQALMVFYNCDLDGEDFDELMARGAVKLKSVDGVLAPNIEYLTAELNQTQTQTLVDYMYQTVLTICGMPNRNGGASTSDTGAAVLLRDGWSLAEARARDIEWSFKKAEKRFLKMVLRICENTLEDFDLKVTDIDLKFTRRNYEAVQSKAQVLDMLLKNDRVDPLEAYSVCGLFSDPEGAYLAGKRFHDEEVREAVGLSEETGHENLPASDEYTL